MSRLFDDLMEGAQALEQHLQGKITLRTETRERIEPASITAEEVKEIKPFSSCLCAEVTNQCKNLSRLGAR